MLVVPTIDYGVNTDQSVIIHFKNQSAQTDVTLMPKIHKPLIKFNQSNLPKASNAAYWESAMTGGTAT